MNRIIPITIAAALLVAGLTGCAPSTPEPQAILIQRISGSAGITADKVEPNILIEEVSGSAGITSAD